jgi:hypothetical protein
MGPLGYLQQPMQSHVSLFLLFGMMVMVEDNEIRRGNSRSYLEM